MRQRPAWAGPTLSAALREDRALGSRDRRLAGDLLTGLIRHERALARIEADPLAAWVSLAKNGAPDLDDPPNAYAVATSLPDDLAAEWWARLSPDDALALARRLAGRAPVALRLLDTSQPPDALLPIAFRSLGPRTVVLEEGINLQTLPAWKEGRVEVQDLGSQRIVDQVAAWVGSGRRVLDLCAGAGGKSLALAAMGLEVQAWDVRPAALEELKKRAARARLKIQVGPPKGRYDLVLVDAPCSGTGVLRRHPENRWKLQFPTEAQRSLLRQALPLAPRVVYATCALTRAENEDGVRSVATPDDERTLWPDDDGQEGFYWACFGG